MVPLSNQCRSDRTFMTGISDMDMVTSKFIFKKHMDIYVLYPCWAIFMYTKPITNPTKNVCVGSVVFSSHLHYLLSDFCPEVSELARNREIPIFRKDHVPSIIFRGPP